MWVSASVTGSDGAEQRLIRAAISLRACMRACMSTTLLR